MCNKIQYLIDWIVLRWMNPFMIDPAGNCPVQAEGLLPTGEWYYFRARGSQWSLEIALTEKHWWNDERLFSYCEPNAFIWPDGGWISRAKACQLATKAIREFYNSKEQ